MENLAQWGKSVLGRTRKVSYVAFVMVGASCGRLTYSYFTLYAIIVNSILPSCQF